MALAPWRVLMAGKIRTDEEEEKRRETGEQGRTVFSPEWERNEKEKTICKALEKVAGEIGAKHITAGIFSFKRKGSLFQLANVLSQSCYRISHAEDTLCFPHYRRSKGRAYDCQFRGIGNLAERGSDQILGKCGPI